MVWQVLVLNTCSSYFIRNQRSKAFILLTRNERIKYVQFTGKNKKDGNSKLWLLSALEQGTFLLQLQVATYHFNALLRHLETANHLWRGSTFSFAPDPANYVTSPTWEVWTLLIYSPSLLKNRIEFIHSDSVAKCETYCVLMMGGILMRQIYSLALWSQQDKEKLRTVKRK